jgi:hypothetical protein
LRARSTPARAARAKIVPSARVGLLEAAEAFAHAERFIRDVLSKTRRAAVSAG